MPSHEAEFGDLLSYYLLGVHGQPMTYWGPMSSLQLQQTLCNC